MAAAAVSHIQTGDLICSANTILIHLPLGLYSLIGSAAVIKTQTNHKKKDDYGPGAKVFQHILENEWFSSVANLIICGL
jgi:hypothetical protein